MDAGLAVKILTLVRLVAFMVMVYVAFGLVVERTSRSPDSQLRAFARIVCSPVTRPLSRLLPPGASHARVLVAALAVTAVVWAVAVALARALGPG